jgi:hypothetical protein
MSLRFIFFSEEATLASAKAEVEPLLRPTVFKAIHPALFEVSQ